MCKEAETFPNKVFPRWNSVLLAKHNPPMLLKTGIISESSQAL